MNDSVEKFKMLKQKFAIKHANMKFKELKDDIFEHELSLDQVPEDTYSNYGRLHFLDNVMGDRETRLYMKYHYIRHNVNREHLVHFFGWSPNAPLHYDEEKTYKYINRVHDDEWLINQDTLHDNLRQMYKDIGNDFTFDDFIGHEAHENRDYIPQDSASDKLMNELVRYFHDEKSHHGFQIREIDDVRHTLLNLIERVSMDEMIDNANINNDEMLLNNLL